MGKKLNYENTTPSPTNALKRIEEEGGHGKRSSRKKTTVVFYFALFFPCALSLCVLCECSVFVFKKKTVHLLQCRHNALHLGEYSSTQMYLVGMRQSQTTRACLQALFVHLFFF